MKHNLILGFGVSYNWVQLRNFVRSIRSTDYKGDVFLILSDRVDMETKRQLQRYNVKWISIQVAKAILSPSMSKQIPRDLHSLPLSALRIPIYLDILLRNKTKYNNVMLTDTRDVVFQENPFSFRHHKICFFFEATNIRIKDEDWNSMWILSAFGTDVLQKMGKRRISCFGTIIGPTTGVIRYLTVALKLLRCVKLGMLWGIEQGIHNYIIYQRKVTSFKIYNSEDGPIFTFGASRIKEINLNRHGVFVNSRDIPIKVIHQYDRHLFLKEFFNRKYE